MGMSEEIALRFSVVGNLMKMRYGDSQVIGRKVIEKSFRPTGDHDRSIEGAIRALSLTMSGNRPEASYTTDERLKNDLDNSFVWDIDPMSGDYVFHRLARHCPHCRGSGYVKKPAPLSCRVDFDAKIEDAVVTIDQVPCRHEPKR